MYVKFKTWRRYRFMILARISPAEKKFRSTASMNSTCNCGSCNCNCGSQLISVEIDEEVKSLIN